MIYVDDMRRLAVARGGSRRARWSHMFTDQDDQTELHEFAASLGLKREWFQNAKWEVLAPWRCHYDVTDTVRARAFELGAHPITYPRGMSDLIEKRKEARALQPPICPGCEMADSNGADGWVTYRGHLWHGACVAIQAAEKAGLL